VETKLRDFRREDFETLWQIDQKCFIPGIAYSRFELATFIRRRGGFTIVAETSPFREEIPVRDSSLRPAAKGSRLRNLEVAGFIIGEISRAHLGHIISIDVLPDARRRGLGSQLLVQAEHRLHTAGCHGVILETAVDNAAAIAFYQRHGYKVVRTVHGYYSNGLDALVLSKRLVTKQIG
jgi:ribosomal-protein-alanine N-acetyltransferase